MLEELEIIRVRGLSLISEGRRLEGIQATSSLESVLITRNGLSLSEALKTSGLLEQDSIRQAIESDPRERYENLTRLLGLESLPVFADSARSHADNLSSAAKERRLELDRVEESVRIAEDELRRTIEIIDNSPEVEQLRRDLTTRFGEQTFALEIIDGIQLDSDRMSRLGTDARRVRDRAADLIMTGSRIREDEARLVEPSPDEVSAAVDRIAFLELELESAGSSLQSAIQALRDALRMSDQLAELAGRALPLLSNICPVCQQSIDTHHVRRHLQNLAKVDGADLQILREKVDEAGALQLQREKALQRAIDERNVLSNLTIESQRVIRERQDWFVGCEGLADGIGTLRPVNREAVKLGNEQAIEGVRSAAVEIERTAREAVAALAIPELTGNVERQRAELSRLRRELDHLRAEVATSNRRAEETRTLARATAKAIASVTERRFKLLAPLVAEIYSRLDPHPAFTQLNYHLGVYRSRPIADPVVTDESEGISADPSVVFSSSQANVAALTFFLAMSWSAGSHALPFLLLDDPLQAMDDINALGFADLCRHIRNARQLVVSTHDRRLGGLLARKLAPRSVGEQTRVIRFVGWERSGPQIEQELVEPQFDEAERRVLLEIA